MIDILMPSLSPTMVEGTLSKWNIKAGDTVSAGQVIAEIETDKASMELEAVDEGVVDALLFPAGATGIKVNTPIARLRSEGESASASEPDDVAPVGSEQAKSAPAPPPVKTLRVELADPVIPEGAKLRKVAVRDALRDAIAEEMRRDPDVFLMGEEVGQYQGAYKVSRDLLQEFGERRVVDTPITEHGFAGIGVGAAMAGLKPIVEFMTFNFAMQAMDQLINSAAKTLYMSGGQIRCPIVFRGPNGAASRVAAQHSQDYSAWYAQVPGLKVVAPYDSADAKGLLKAAIRDPNPVIMLEHEMIYGQEFDLPDVEDWIVPIGKGKVRIEGADVTLTAHSRMVGFALQAAERLAMEGISAEVIDLRTLRPLDHTTIVQSVKKTHRLVTVEEGWGPFGVGAEVAARVVAEAFDDLDAAPVRVHQSDNPMPYAANLEALSLPSVDAIVDAARSVLHGRVDARPHRSAPASNGNGPAEPTSDERPPRLLATPLARRVAEAKQIDLANVKGSGPHGRIVRADLEGAEAGRLAPGPAILGDWARSLERQGIPLGSYDLVPLDGMRRAIAARLTQSYRDAPHFPLSVDLEVDALEELRSKINAALEKSGNKVSINDILIKACANALAAVPAANASYTPDGIAMHRHADVAVAVAVAGGLITPIVRAAEAKSISSISNEMKDLAARARSRKLAPSEFHGGTFSLSNLGMFGIKHFSSILNEPQGCILSVGAIERRAVEREGRQVFVSVMNVTLTCDHRVVDGAVGAGWLQAFRGFVEHPMTMLV